MIAQSKPKDEAGSLVLVISIRQGDIEQIVNAW